MCNSPGESTLQQLPRGQCAGVSMAMRLAWPSSFVAETLTVREHDRKHPAEFYRSGAHRRGMERGAARTVVEFPSAPRVGESGGSAASRRCSRHRGTLERGEHRAVDEGTACPGEGAVCPASGGGAAAAAAAAE